MTKIIKSKEPNALKRTFAYPVLFAKRFKSVVTINVLTAVPKLAPNIIGIAISTGKIPCAANTTTIPEVIVLECMRTVIIQAIRYARIGEDMEENIARNSGLFFRGVIAIERRLSANKTKPMKKTGLLAFRVFLGPNFSKKPTIIRIGAMGVEERSTS